MIILYPGSFSKLHAGHLAMTNYAEKKYNTEVIFEISKKVFDKPDVSDKEIDRRVNQFVMLDRKCIVTNNSSFVNKSKYSKKPLELSGITYFELAEKLFIVGRDTIERIDDKKYYFGSELEKVRCLNFIRDNKWKFLVFPRGGHKNHSLSNDIMSMCEFADDFTPMDISSSSLLEEETSQKYPELQPDLAVIENVSFGECISIGKQNYKLISTKVWKPYEVTCFNGEEYITLPFGTICQVLDTDLFPNIKGYSDE